MATAYREPGVKVTEDFENALPALATFSLPNVSVGPAYQVATQLSAGTYDGTGENYDYPQQILGTFIDTRDLDPNDETSYPVAVDLKDVVLTILTGTASGAISSYDLNQFSDATPGAFDNIASGDVIIIPSSVAGNAGQYTVRTKVNATTVQVNETFTAPEASISYTVRRNIQNTVGIINIPTSTSGVAIDDEEVALPGGLTYTLAPFGACNIESATVLISYRALRIEKSQDVFEYDDVASLQADFGLDQIVPENPVVFGAYVALNNSVTATNILEIPQDYLTLPDELIAYNKAFDILALTEMYAISVMTQNTSVHLALNTHVNGYSDPDMKLERVGIVNRRLVTTQVVVDSVETAPSEGFTSTAVLISGASHFITDGVVPGMYVNVTSPTNIAGRYVIGAVNSQSKLTLAGNGVASIAGVVDFFIDEDLTKDQQASIMAAYASSIGNRRMVMTWPDIVKIPVGANIRPLPGFFLNPCVGALTTGLPTQQGLTNLSVALFSGVVHSTKYFNRDQMNTIAGGGVMIFVQDVLDQTALYIRHQLTTDRSAIKFQEYSITKNVDFIAKFIRTNHKQFPGKYNIVDNAFDDLKSNAQGIITYLRDNTKLPKIGGVIKSGKLVSAVQDPANIDTIIERWSLDIPIPLNNLDITIVV